MLVNSRHCFLGWCVVYVFGNLFIFIYLKVTEDVGNLLGEKKVDAVLCVAGGWAGGNAKAKCKL